MMVSTRGRYALRMMIDLAENSHDHAYIAMKDIAERLEISKKYMEQIMPVLVKNGLVEGLQGQGGGIQADAPSRGLPGGRNPAPDRGGSRACILPVGRQPLHAFRRLQNHCHVEQIQQADQ